jgi:hypothetical protein
MDQLFQKYGLFNEIRKHVNKIDMLYNKENVYLIILRCNLLIKTDVVS